MEPRAKEKELSFKEYVELEVKLRKDIQAHLDDFYTATGGLVEVENIYLDTARNQQGEVLHYLVELETKVVMR